MISYIWPAMITKYDLRGTAEMLKVTVTGSDGQKFIGGNGVPIVYSRDVWLLCDALASRQNWLLPERS
ncbi:hypothetical protein CEXT_544651 [Caerostris extrusa]|uniref:Uncharacterized protein n=1 Tax=Caerostris extrusa TaxID=172846 RepID=A0AAV4P014_CAEEX|nr:hypothetical protein CEXT_544651 [Caerostris extrusa]